MVSQLSAITIDDYPGVIFYPFHQLKKLNGGVEPYIKSIATGKYNFDFFKVEGVIYAIKPTDKNDISKTLCARVENKITLESTSGSISGNCAKGIKEQFVRFCQELNKEGLSKEEYFYKLLKK